MQRFACSCWTPVSCRRPPSQQAEQAARRTAEALLAQERAQRSAEAAELEASRREVAAQKASLTVLQALSLLQSVFAPEIRALLCVYCAALSCPSAALCKHAVQVTRRPQA